MSIERRGEIDQNCLKDFYVSPFIVSAKSPDQAIPNYLHDENIDGLNTDGTVAQGQTYATPEVLDYRSRHGR